jgi:mRNA interferase RelE/StbE
LEYKLSFKSSVKRDLKNISGKNVKMIFSALQELKSEPYANPKLKGKFEGLRKYRIGNFRVIYTIIDHEILILRISDRKDAYKNG